MKGYLGRTLLMALIALLWAPHALAQSAENKAAARNLGIEGIKLADAGDCEAAAEKLQRAEALYHAPTILGRLGECQVNLGRIVEGTENLNRVVREPLPSNAPDAFLKARERAQKVLDSALPKIARLKIFPPCASYPSSPCDRGCIHPFLFGHRVHRTSWDHPSLCVGPGRLPQPASGRPRLFR